MIDPGKRYLDPINPILHEIVPDLRHVLTVLRQHGSAGRKASGNAVISQGGDTPWF